MDTLFIILLRKLRGVKEQINIVKDMSIFVIGIKFHSVACCIPRDLAIIHHVKPFRFFALIVLDLKLKFLSAFVLRRIE